MNGIRLVKPCMEYKESYMDMLEEWRKCGEPCIPWVLGLDNSGIRPSQRRKGYATCILQLALKQIKALGVDRVLVCCDKINNGSARAIQKNGGILESEVLDEEGVVVQRYWIELFTPGSVNE